MIKQIAKLSQLAPKSLKFTEIPFNNPLAIALPGISSETQKVALELLEKNHKEFDIFYNDLHFHNHFVHHVLAAYSMGASVDNLNEVYDKNYVLYQRPLPPSRIKITRENWTEHLGKAELWTDYLKFFNQVLKEDGMENSFNTFSFHPELFPRLIAGAFHSAIHLGYGVEFQIPFILSEGFAQAAVHQNEFENVLTDKFFSSEGIKKKSIMDIVKSTHKENRFNVTVHSTREKAATLLKERSDLVRDYAKDWEVIETEEGIREAVKELYEASVIVYGGAAVRPGHKAIHLEFLLMHILTSILMIFEMLPYLSLDKQRMMLKAHFAGLLTEYIAQGRPPLHFELLKNYAPKTIKETPNPWLEVVQRSLIEKDSHVMKVIRALLKAEELFPQKDDIYLKLAQMTCESYRVDGWARGVGFDEQWTDSKAVRVKMEPKALGY